MAEGHWDRRALQGFAPVFICSELVTRASSGAIRSELSSCLFTEMVILDVLIAGLSGCGSGRRWSKHPVLL